MSYIISEPAKLDINDIYEFSIIEFGLDQTITYLMQMEEVFKIIEKHHYIGTSRNHISNDLFSFPFKSHIIFYRIAPLTEIIILRILHGSRDVPKHFKT